MTQGFEAVALFTDLIASSCGAKMRQNVKITNKNVFCRGVHSSFVKSGEVFDDTK
jgi:hypothetical protein